MISLPLAGIDKEVYVGVLCMLEEEASVVGGQEEIVKLKRRRLSNLRHNFVQQQIYKTLPQNKVQFTLVFITVIYIMLG